MLVSIAERQADGDDGRSVRTPSHARPAQMRGVQPAPDVVGPPPPPIHDGPGALYRRRKQPLAWGAAAQTTSRRELFVAYDVCLTGWRESLIAAVLSTPSNSEDLSSHVSLPQEPCPTRARRRFVRYADAHTGSRPGGVRRRGSSAGCPARGRRARDAPAPPDPRRDGARCPEAGCRWGAWRGDADPCGGPASSDAPSAS